MYKVSKRHVQHKHDKHTMHTYHIWQASNAFSHPATQRFLTYGKRRFSIVRATKLTSMLFDGSSKSRFCNMSHILTSLALSREQTAICSLTSGLSSRLSPICCFGVKNMLMCTTPAQPFSLPSQNQYNQQKKKKINDHSKNDQNKLNTMESKTFGIIGKQ